MADPTPIPPEDLNPTPDLVAPTPTPSPTPTPAPAPAPVPFTIPPGVVIAFQDVQAVLQELAPAISAVIAASGNPIEEAAWTIIDDLIVNPGTALLVHARLMKKMVPSKTR